jgi:hypothetical protein
MAIYYVDLDNPGAWNGRGGTNHTGDEWLGLSGLQKAADTITAGNSMHIKGTVVCTNLLNVSHDAWSGTALTRGESCSWAGGTGVVSEPNTGVSDGVVIERLTGNNPVDNETITGGTSGQTVTVDASASSVKNAGLDVDTNGGTTADGLVKYIGVNGSWVNEKTRAKLDGNAGAIAGCNNIIATTTVDYLYFENIEVDDSDANGFNYISGSYYNVYINCWAHHCDVDGFVHRTYDLFINCLASNNGSRGFYSGSSGTRYICCVAHNNAVGSLDYGSSVFIACIVAENTSQGICSASSANSIFFSVIDENADALSFLGGTRHLAMFNRITNQSDDGIVATAGEMVYEDWNLFYGNVGDDYNDTAGAGLIEKGGNSKTDSAADGYANQAGHDFNLTDAADYRREAITLPKWDGTSP